ncbi:transcriptional regulator, TetR family [Propionispora hippei DSM 15287]|uniref:Transcriptional regulator, TetR family n=1 Tax=Propionispora hippei DSM 15287 TaxID=1123003 RepID=A0A1M6NGB4_9FIRM|nr:transcriptional regulator, TetR family [Propionispora hippei DSM 15287]
MIDAAFELFCSAGYEQTMIIDIVKRAGVAKGTFYYYFPTKEAILEAICNRWDTELAVSFRLKGRRDTALGTLQAFILQMTLPSQLDVLFEKLCEENQFNLLYQIWQRETKNVFNPLLVDLIRQGNQEGTMQVTCINETLAFFWSALECLWDALYLREPSDILRNKIKVAEAVLERILGTEEGALQLSVAWPQELLGNDAVLFTPQPASR